MSVFKNLFGLMDRKTSFPTREEIIPEKLYVIVDEFEVQTSAGPVSGWSYTTEGFHHYGQKEMVFLLSREKDESSGTFSQEPLEMFAALEPFAEKGETVDVGAVTMYGGPGPFGKQLVYLPPVSMDGLEVPADSIIPMLATTDEAQSVRNFGVTRFMARLGQATNIYPCPIWSDRSREPLSAEVDTETVLDRVECIPSTDLVIYQEGEAFYLRNSQQAVEKLKDELPLLVPMAFLTGLDRKADACLVWKAGQVDPQAVIRPGAEGDRLCGCFLLIVPGQEVDQWQIMEDGFAWLVTQRTWQTMRDGLAAGKSVKAAMVEERLSFSFLLSR